MSFQIVWKQLDDLLEEVNIHCFLCLFRVTSIYKEYSLQLSKQISELHAKNSTISYSFIVKRQLLAN